MKDMTVAVDTDTLEQLKSSKARSLLDTIDSLRSLGIGSIINLPQIVVVGDQSSGKSSVLEAISHIRFPVRGDICTRFTTELILRQGPKSRADIEVLFDDKTRPIHKFPSADFSQDDLPDIIDKAKDVMGIGRNSDHGFSRDVLRLRIEGPDMCPLTLVDLPGFFHSETADQSQQGKETVDRIAAEYMKRPNTIMLAVVSANQQLASQIVLQATKKHDPERQRTLGIITKPDLVSPRSTNEAKFMQLAKNQEAKHKLALGWHVLRNRAEEEDEMANRDAAEDLFFSQGTWASIYETNRGIKSLRSKLSEVLFEHIQKSIPGVINDIKASLAERQADLESLGRARSTPEEMRAYIVEIAEKYQRIAQAGVDGRYNDPFFGELEDEERKLRALLRNFNSVFGHVMSTKGMSQQIVGENRPDDSEAEPLEYLQLFMEKYPYDFPAPERITDKTLDFQLIQLASINQGREFPGTPNRDLVIQLFQKQSLPWRRIAQFHIDQVMTAVKAFVDELVIHLTPAKGPTAEAILRARVDPFFEQKEALLALKLDEILRPYSQGYGLSLGSGFRTNLNARLVERLAGNMFNEMKQHYGDTGETKISRKAIAQALENAEGFSDNEFGTERVVDMMEALYETSLGTFIENVISLAIESCLISDIASIITPTHVNLLDQEALAELAAESPDVQSKRVQVQKEVRMLTEGLKLVSKQRVRPKTTLRATALPPTPAPTPPRTSPSPPYTAKVTPSRGTSNTGGFGLFGNLNSSTVTPSNLFGTTSTPVNSSTTPGVRSIFANNKDKTPTGGDPNKPIAWFPVSSTQSPSNVTERPFAK